MMFYNRYSLSDVSKYKNVVKECGYTENGASYMYYRSGQWIIAVAGIIIITVVMAACIRMIVKIGHNDIYSYVINLDTENQQLKKNRKQMKDFLLSVMRNCRILQRILHIRLRHLLLHSVLH